MASRTGKLNLLNSVGRTVGRALVSKPEMHQLPGASSPGPLPVFALVPLGGFRATPKPSDLSAPIHVYIYPKQPMKAEKLAIVLFMSIRYSRLID